MWCTFGRYINYAKKHANEMPHARAAEHAAALGRMTRMAALGSYSHATHNVDRSVTSDTRIHGGIHVHSVARFALLRS